MEQPPNPVNIGNLIRASRLGIALSVAGVFLFVALWLLLEPIGIDQVPRLIVSICLPPALIALVVGGYFLLFQPRNRNNG